MEAMTTATQDPEEETNGSVIGGTHFVYRRKDGCATD
jgi:hypothetical protein